MRRLLLAVALLLLSVDVQAQLELRPEIVIPELNNFKPLPEQDAEFTRQIEALVKESKLDEMVTADKNPDKEDEWSSVCVVDLRDIAKPRVAGWKADNFIYPASSYKLYVLGEIIREVCEGTLTLDQRIEVSQTNAREGDRLKAGDTPTVSEVLRLMMTYSDNTAANVSIDLADRQRASALLRAMGLTGSDITRKYLSRKLEDEGYAEIPGTVSNAHAFATFIYAVETGAIGGGRGRGLIKGYMATNVTQPNRMRAGLPDSATIYTKTGWWNIFSSQEALIEDGAARYIICVLTPYGEEEANKRIADFTRKVHSLMTSPTIAPPVAEAVAAEAVQEEFTVILSDFGTEKISVIKEIRTITGLGLKEAKDLVEGAPRPVSTGVSREEAEKIKQQLEQVGATVEIK